MGFRAVADEIALSGAQIDGKAKAFGDHRGAGDERAFAVQRRQFGIRQNRLPAPEPDLVQPHPRPHQDREGTGADFGMKRAGIALGDTVEFLAAIGDGPGQQVEPPGRAFRIRHRRQPDGQGQPFHQRHDIDAALFQHRAGRQVDPVHLEFRDAVGDGSALAGKERCPHPVGHGAESEIEARGLDLRVGDRNLRRDLARGDHRADGAVGKDSGSAHPKAPDMRTPTPAKGWAFR